MPQQHELIELTAPATFGQERLWFLENLIPEQPLFNMVAIVTITGRVDEKMMDAALSCVCRNHEALRVKMADVDGELRQVISNDGRSPLRVINLTRPDFETKVHDEIEKIRQEKLCKHGGQLFKCTLIKLPSDQNIFVVLVHHAIFDGVSASIFFKEFGSYYNLAMRGDVIAQIPVSDGYLKYCSEQRSGASNANLEMQLSYWTAKLAGVEHRLKLPWDRRRPAIPTFQAGRVAFKVSRRLARQITDLARREKATIFNVFLAAYVICLQMWTGDDDVVVGVPMTLREPSTQGSIGFYVNLVAIRLSLKPDISVPEAIAHVREVLLEAIENRNISFERVVRALHKRPNGHNPIFDATFNFLSEDVKSPEDANLNLVGLDTKFNEPAVSNTYYDLSLSIRNAQGGEIFGTFEYLIDLFDEPTVHLFSSQFVKALEEIVDSSQQIGRITLQSKFALMRSATGQEVAESMPPEWVNEIVARGLREHFPASGCERTATDISQHSGRLATHLLELKTKPNQRVLVRIDDPEKLEMAILGVLKAGAVPVVSGDRTSTDRLIQTSWSKFGLAITESKFKREAFVRCCRAVFLDQDWCHLCRFTPPVIEIIPGNLESGSIGFFHDDQALIFSSKQTAALAQSMRHRHPDDHWILNEKLGDDPTPKGSSLAKLPIIFHMARPSDVRILSAYLLPLPAGTVGELFLSGPSAAAEVVGSPSEVCTTMVANPYGTSGSLMYRTGYQGRRNLTGKIEVLDHL